MVRPYDSTRRREQAQDTRRRILDAAVELHGQGITAYEPLAEAAGVSVATVRKHFPSKELLFEGCTDHFFASFEKPALQEAAALSEPGARVAEVTAEMCRANEAAHDLVWHGHAWASESAALTAAIHAYSELVAAAAATVVDGAGLGLSAQRRATVRRRVAALLDPLTYRAFRVHAGFGRESCRRELTALVSAALHVSPSPRPRSSS